MPIYTYQCKDCNHKFERYLMTTQYPVTCSSCGSMDVRKIPSKLGYRRDRTVNP